MQECKSWTYHPSQASGVIHSSCWLHSAVGPSRKEAGAISGVPSGSMPPIPPPAPPSPHPHGGGGSMGGWSGPEACSPGTNGTAFKFCDHTLPMSTRLDDLVHRVEVDEIASELTGPSSPKPNPFGTLNATGPSRVTLSLRQEQLRAGCGPRTGGKGGL